VPDFYERPGKTQLRTQGRKCKLIGQKPPLKRKEVWSIRVRFQIKEKARDLALFNLAIDSKLRSCDLVALRVSDIAVADNVRERAVIVQQKTGRPVQFELTEQTRASVDACIVQRKLRFGNYLFSSRVHACPHLSARQYARVVNQWVESIGLDPYKYGTHSLRRTKAALIYKNTGNLRAVQLLLGHTRLESTVRYLGIEVDDALQISERVEL
jgi:integrase